MAGEQPDDLEELVSEEREASRGDESKQGPSFWEKIKGYLPWILGAIVVIVLGYLVYQNSQANNSSSSNSGGSGTTNNAGDTSGNGTAPVSTSDNGQAVSDALNAFGQQMQSALNSQAAGTQQEIQSAQQQQNSELQALQGEISQSQQNEAAALQSQATAVTSSEQQLADQLQSSLAGIQESVAQGYAPPPPVQASSTAPAPQAAPSTAPSNANPVAIVSASQAPGFQQAASEMTPSEAAVVAGASSQPLSSGQVSQIQQAEGGTPLTDWQKQFLETGGNTTIPAAPGGKGPTKYVNGVPQNS